MNDFIGSAGYNRPTEEQVKAKKMMKVIGIILVLLLLLIIGLIALIYYIQSTQLKIYVDAKSNSKMKNIFVFDQNNNLYIPIRAFAEYVGYSSGNGEYKEYAEDITKCYVESKNEIASFSLGSNKIYKIILDGNNDYEYYEINEPIKMFDNQLYTTIEGAQIAFNISMAYNQEQNQINIYTLPYLVSWYTTKFQNAGIADKDASFSNQKALLYNMLIVKNENGSYGVQTLDGQEVLGTKYANIKFVESAKEFIVTTMEKKVGIMSYDAKIKIAPEYDAIKQIDKDSGLYLATKNKKQGVINSNGSIVLYLEYDQIGVNSNQYINNKIKNQYLLYNKCIPAKKNGTWEIFDKTGKNIVENGTTYQDLGCSIGGNNNDKNSNSVLLIPQYEGIVVCRNNVYGLIDSDGKSLLPIALQSIYSITSEGEEIYYMLYNNQLMNIIDYIKKWVRPEKNPETNTEDTDTNTENTNNETTNTNTQTQNNETAGNTTQTSTNTVENTTQTSENAVSSTTNTNSNTTTNNTQQ